MPNNVKSGTVPPPAIESTCVACKSQIPVGASVCSECDTWQDWTRYISRWSATLTALLAVAPVWAGAVALYAIAFKRSADVQVQALSCAGLVVKLAIANDGGSAGNLGRLDHRTAFGWQYSWQADLARAEGRASMVQPEAAFVLNLEPRVAGVPTALPVAVSASRCEYRVRTIVRDFKGGTQERIAECPCTVGSSDGESG